jgi:hypothetical protein
LTQAGTLPLIAVMVAAVEAPPAAPATLSRELAPAPVPVSSQISSVSETRSASSSAMTPVNRMDPTQDRDAATPSVPPSAPSVDGQQPAAQPAGAAPAAPADAPAPGSGADAAPAESTPDEPAAAPSGEAGSAPDGQRAPSQAGDGAAEGGADPGQRDVDARAADEVVGWHLPDSLRSRWTVAYASLVDRVGRWLNRQAPMPAITQPEHPAQQAVPDVEGSPSDGGAIVASHTGPHQGEARALAAPSENTPSGAGHGHSA